MKLKFKLMSLMIITASSVQAEVKLPAIFNRNMIIQREIAAPIWGWADPSEAVKVSGSWGAATETVAGKDGKWQVKLPTPKAGGPFTITIQGKNKIELTNVLSGDIWFCSGQSNMQFKLCNAINGKQEVADANYPEIRLFSVKQNYTLTPQPDTVGKWELCSPTSAATFTAAGYFFGRKLYQDLKIPIGLINCALGGTCIEAWTPMDKQIGDPVVKKIKDNYDQAVASYTPEKAKEKLAEEKIVWQQKMDEWKKAGSKGSEPRAPRLAPHPQKHQNYPANLYNAMVIPVLPFAIKGVIWYQGEHNYDRPGNYQIQLERLIGSWREAWGNDHLPFYFVQLPNFGKPWTKPAEGGSWAVLREAFLLAAQKIQDTGMAVTIDIGEANDIHPKNKQDVGDRLARLALSRTYGQKDVIWTGPIFKSAAFDGGKVVVSFETGGAPLAIKGDKIVGFDLTDDKGSSIKADAVISGSDTVIVSAQEVKIATAVYYGWAGNPSGINLINKAGLPASPFRAKK